MNNKLLVLGTVAYDAIETPFGKTGKILGGCATYIGLAASHFNTECGLISIIGSDFEEEHLNLLKEKNLNLEGVNINKFISYLNSKSKLKYNDSFNIGEDVWYVLY